MTRACPEDMAEKLTFWNWLSQIEKKKKKKFACFHSSPCEGLVSTETITYLNECGNTRNPARNRNREFLSFLHKPDVLTLLQFLVERQMRICMISYFRAQNLRSLFSRQIAFFGGFLSTTESCGVFSTPYSVATVGVRLQHLPQSLSHTHTHFPALNIDSGEVRPY